jgi:TRAP-type C4-dicarboxylate transport system permease small subunit
MRRVSSAIHTCSYFMCFVGMLFAIPLMLLTVADVLGRAFLDKPIPGSFELSEYMLSVLILFGAAYTQQVKGHVGVTYLTRKLSFRGQALCSLITTGASLFIVSILVWQGYVDAVQERAVSDQLRIPQWPFKMLVAIGGGLLWLELALDFVESAREALGKGK